MNAPSSWKLQLLVPRMFRAAALDRRLYSEVAADKGATLQAFLVVLLVGIATGIGALDESGVDALQGIPAGIVLAFAGWVVGAYLAMLIGTKLLKAPQTHGGWGELARAMGFAQAPGILRVFGIIPGLGVAIAAATLIWWFLGMLIAIRQSLNYGSDWRAFFVVLIGLPFYVFIVAGYSQLLD